MDEAWSFRDLMAAGWSEADLEWERLGLQALSDLGEGRERDAFEAIREALYLARVHFKRGDPRLAASLTNQAAAIAAADPTAATDVIVRAAEQAWDACAGTLATMAAPRRARSSLFHLRMERRHRATYEERWQDESRRRLAELRADLAGAEAPVLIERLEARERAVRWLRERPAVLDDSRKLLAATILLAARGAGVHVPAEAEARGHAGSRQREGR